MCMTSGETPLAFLPLAATSVCNLLMHPFGGMCVCVKTSTVIARTRTSVQGGVRDVSAKAQGEAPVVSFL